MSATERLLITDVVNQAVIAVDERGTVAAAATSFDSGPAARAQDERIIPSRSR